MSSFNIVTFPFAQMEGRQVNLRSIRGTEDSLWFVLRDVLDGMCSATTTTEAVASITQGLGEGYVVTIAIPDALGRVRETLVAHESAVTYLVSRSNTEAGRKLNRFLHLEVLPALRKTGKFEVQPEPQPEAEDTIISALITTLKKVDQLQIQQAALHREQLVMREEQALARLEVEDRLNNVEIQHRNGIPKGHLSKSQALELYGHGLSEKVFHEVMLKFKVLTTGYIHRSEEGHEVATQSYLTEDIQPAIDAFLLGVKRVSACFFKHELISQGRFRVANFIPVDERIVEEATTEPAEAATC